MEDRLLRLLKAHRLSCGVVVSETGEIAVRAGDFSAFASNGLLSALLGPYGSAKNTYSLAQDPLQLTPILYGQGGDFAILQKIGAFVVIVFGRDCGDAVAQYTLSRQVGDSISREFVDATSQ